ncbi:hypothetical protein FSP39_008639 [Pinctada imbricata]|uniref:TMEM205-like domain-containing protein n=1 Tax=Pinctada imbricata TaxID=66713 RepID=A0AA88XS72_PINIB|nr:hypothetical protein FSP39_008639 [Pinctada imbricata]
MIMILTIPRYWFGQLQARIFPIFFSYGTIMSAVTMTTFFILRKDNDGTVHFRMTCGLFVSFTMSLLNLCVLSGLIVDIMRKRFDLEKESGLSMKIGFVDMSPLDGNDVYQRVNWKFRFFHKLNGLTNIFGMLGQFVYLFYLKDFVEMK